jgi:hypothetical protein
VTALVCDYREKHVYPVIERSGFGIIRRQGALARRHYVAPEARKQSVMFMTGVGHGFEDTYTGDYSDTVFKIGEYDREEVTSKIVHFLSCQTARRLGPDFVRNGARAYFGYDENFTYFEEHAASFLECDAEIDIALAGGNTARQAANRARAKYDDNIAKFIAAGKLYVAATLQYNRDHLRSPLSDPAWGDPNAKL